MSEKKDSVITQQKTKQAPIVAMMLKEPEEKSLLIKVLPDW